MLNTLFFGEGLQNLVSLYKFLNFGGDYIEK